MLSVVEKFVSINGEGAHAGELAAFIRFKGCNLNCSYCDTKWANAADAPFESETPQELLKWVLDQDVCNVTLTGGEPLLQKDIAQLIELLCEQGLRVEIETNGSIPLEKFSALPLRPVFTMDYKLPSSGMEQKMCLNNLALLQKSDSVKFVTGSLADLETALHIITQYSLSEKCHVYFSPVFGSIEPSRIVEFMQEHHLKHARIQLQLHKYIWPPEMRGV